MPRPFDMRNQSSPFGGGYVPGYNDPLSRPFGPGPMGPGGMGGMPSPAMPTVRPGDFLRGGPMVGTGGLPLTSARQNEMRMNRNSFSPGDFIREPLDWLKEGAGNVVEGAGRFLSNPENLSNVVDIAGIGASIYGANRDRAAYERQYEDQKRLEEEERQRRAGYGPLVGAVLGRMTSAAGG